MLLARVGFDLLRSETFPGLIRAHIQRKLNELKLPDFIDSFEVSWCPVFCHSNMRVATRALLGLCATARALCSSPRCAYSQHGQLWLVPCFVASGLSLPWVIHLHGLRACAPHSSMPGL